MNGARPGGFTLVEMIVTLIIVALIAAVAGPRFFSLSAFQESGFYDETVSAVRYAQKYAVASGCTVRVQTTAPVPARSDAIDWIETMQDFAVANTRRGLDVELGLAGGEGI